MTIAENIALATGYPRRSAASSTGARPRRPPDAALAQVDCPLAPTTRVRDLTRTEKSLVAIARALAVAGRRARARRALRLAARRRGASAVRRPAAAESARRRHDLCLASARRGVRDRRPHRGAARRRSGRRTARRRHDAGGTGLADRRQGARASSRLRRASVGGRSGWRCRGARPSRARARSISTVAQSEIVGLVGLRGAGQERIGRALFGALPHSRRRFASTARAPNARRPGSGDAGGHRPHRARPRRRIRSQRPHHPRERLPQSRRDRPRLRLPAFAASGGARRRRAIGDAVGLRPNDPSLPIEVALRRQSAKGGRRALARASAAGC